MGLPSATMEVLESNAYGGSGGMGLPSARITLLGLERLPAELLTEPVTGSTIKTAKSKAADA